MCERGVDYSHIYQIGPCSRLRPNLKASLPKWLEHDIATPAEKNENQHVRSYRHIDLAQSKQIIVANRWIEIKHAPGQSTGKVTKFKMPAGLQRTGAIKCTTCLPEDEAMNLCAGVPRQMDVANPDRRIYLRVCRLPPGTAKENRWLSCRDRPRI